MSSSHLNFAPGSCLGDRYVVDQLLGKRAGRRTFLARDLQTQEQVVVKLLTFGAEFEWDDLKLFEREAEILRSLNHPAIPRYLDYFELASPHNSFALVQTYIKARSLAAQLQAGRTFSATEVRHLAHQLLDILIYLHQQHPPVIHRDLKPSNILLADAPEAQSGQVYLVDFGSVQTLAAREGGTITIVGTYGYMPPEQFGGRAVPASDLYSLGATLIYLVTGHHPADLPQDDLRIQFDSLTPQDLPPALVDWLRQMTEPSLQRRFSSASSALQQLINPSLGAIASSNDQSTTRRVQPYQRVDRAITLPSDSKVQFHQTVDRLEITLPPEGFRIEVGFLMLFAIAWNSFLVVWLLGWTLGSSVTLALFGVAFSLPFWAVGLGMVGQVLKSLFARTQITIDSQQLTLAQTILNWNYAGPRTIPHSHIQKLVYKRARLLQTLSTQPSSELTNPDDAFVKPQITICAGTRTYDVGESLSEPEQNWLANKLSYWLDLPIQ